MTPAAGPGSDSRRYSDHFGQFLTQRGGWRRPLSGRADQRPASAEHDSFCGRRQPPLLGSGARHEVNRL